MKLRTLIQGFAATAATVAFASGAFAMDSVRHQGESAPFGSASVETAATRVIKLDTGSWYLNVQRGETVTIVNGAKALTWRFDTLGTPSFELAKIAPPDFGAGHIRVYVARSPYDSN